MAKLLPERASSRVPSRLYEKWRIRNRMEWEELQKLAEAFREGKPGAGQLDEVGPNTIAYLVLTLRDARRFRGEGKTHKVCEFTTMGECWICGKDE